MKQKSVIHGIELVTVGSESLLKAQERVVACQSCSPSVSRPFGSVLTEVLGAIGPSTEFVLSSAATCPNCGQPIVENTMVRCEGELNEAVIITPAYETCWEDTDVILIDEAVLREAQSFITGCQECVPYAEMTFDYILDAVTERDPSVTEYVLCHSAKCPRCQNDVHEKTFVLAADTCN
jgi:hypothetical protein